ncbi:MAG TPA: phosphate ABC transporter permease subunit PstC [Candidatus Limnocylindria bacterium]|nr:phosphate ABC transporter permease subunit PstC [Candidatus Limnocylindria bacterium]
MSASAAGLRGRGAGRLADRAFRWLITAAGSAVLLVLALMLLSTTYESLPIFAKEGILGFLGGTTWAPGGSRTEITGEYGALPFLWGTSVSSLIAVALALPLSIGIALFVTQLAPAWLRRPASYAVDLLAMIPSVVIGLWALLFFVPLVVYPLMELLAGTLGTFIPLFAGPPTVRSLFAAGIVLALMITPIITAIVREVFDTVPADERYAAFAVGATRWEVMRHVVVPRSRPGIIGATMLGLGRALGETIAVLMVIGGSPHIRAELFQPAQTIAGQIASGFAEASPEGISGLIALGVALFLMTVLINVVARAIVWRLGETRGDAGL